MKRYLLGFIYIITVLITFTACTEKVEIQRTFFNAVIGSDQIEVAKNLIQKNSGQPAVKGGAGLYSFYDIDMGGQHWYAMGIDATNGYFSKVIFFSQSFEDKTDAVNFEEIVLGSLRSKYPMKEEGQYNYRYVGDKQYEVSIMILRNQQGSYEVILEYSNPQESHDSSSVPSSDF